MLIFLYGADTFRSRAQMKKMIDKFKKDRDPQGYNTISLDTKKTEDQNKIISEILAAPFLAERRMVVVENLLVSKQKELLKSLIKRIEENTLPETNVVLFWEDGEEFKDKDAKLLFDRLLKEKYTQRFEELKGVKLSAWIDNEVKERGGKIDRVAVQYLVDNINGDMWRLNAIIDQVLSLCHSERSPDSHQGVAEESLLNEQNDKSIINLEKQNNQLEKGSLRSPRGSVGMTTLGDVKLFLPEKVDDSIFNLVDAIVAKQPKNVFKMIQEQYRKGEDAQFVFAMILRQFRILLELRDLFEREDNLPSDIIAKRLALHPFVVKKSLPLLKRYSLEELKNIYHQLLEIDIKTKTGRGDQSVLLDVFVGRLAM
jgi:DNA polymerase-3 subunit delta